MPAASAKGSGIKFPDDLSAVIGHHHTVRNLSKIYTGVWPAVSTRVVKSRILHRKYRTIFSNGFKLPDRPILMSNYMIVTKKKKEKKIASHVYIIM